MRKVLFFLVAVLVVSASFLSCQKDPVTNPNSGQEDPVSVPDYIGTYDLEVITDSLSTDGYWEVANASENPSLHGYLTISKSDNGDWYEVLGIVIVGSASQEVTYYQTTATLNANNELELADCDITWPSGIEVHNSFSPISNTLPSLSFRSEMHFQLAGADCGYVLRNNAVKREQ